MLKNTTFKYKAKLVKVFCLNHNSLLHKLRANGKTEIKLPQQLKRYPNTLTYKVMKNSQGRILEGGADLPWDDFAPLLKISAPPLRTFAPPLIIL